MLPNTKMTNPSIKSMDKKTPLVLDVSPLRSTASLVANLRYEEVRAEDTTVSQEVIEHTKDQRPQL